ncbi:sulfite exporter TauE/SafE family protein [Dokdonella sp.]|uniref:sulfite exporter TauE/SafE family protein n=1 Tax=Dokdonella sp. TaxID=2291710 RepID=UPI0025BC4FAC|nr:sulfite exporter TauE/SafE family protein [Dokdonella sp.]MBX3689267.1 sulfite exporter TauE/SafE family protein [Dokdonella sp.]
MFPLPELTPDQINAILPFILVGFFAQLVDGALGMAFGVITNTLLVSVLGVAPARASASVHLVESFTTCASGLSHVLHGNVDWKLFRRLTIPGVAGGVLGAYLLSNIDGAVARPFVMAYLAGIGFYLLWRAWRMRRDQVHGDARFAAPLGLVGGFLDAAGGGGWGAVVTSNLLAQGTEPRRTIGTVNAAEFFVTATVSASFMVTIGISAFSIAAIGLVAGGLVAAPFGAMLAKKIPARRLLLFVSALLIATSSFSLYRALV